MKHTKHRILALILALTMVFGMVPALALMAGAEEAAAPVIEVGEDGAIGNLTWENAYVGSSYHATNAWKVVSTEWSDAYRLSGAVTVPNAGTTLVWSESAANGTMSKNAFFLTSWKNVNGTWTVDLAGVNLIADGSNNTDNQFYDAAADTITYVYTTTTDNEVLRFAAYAKGASATECPTVYAYNATFADGAVNGIQWFAGYVGSYTNTNGYKNDIKQLDSAYTYSAPVLVPKAGTTISFTDSISGYASNAAYVFSTWVAGDDGRLEMFYGCPGNNASDAKEAWLEVTEEGYVYSYTTAYDNEIVRLCYRGTPEQAPAVTYVEDNAANLRPVLEAAGYDPAQTGTPYMMAGWKTGTVGSFSNKFVLGADDYGYRVTDIIPVLGKGTTVTFTDVISPEAAAAGEANFIDADRYAISSFFGENYTGSNSNDIKSVNPDFANVKGFAAGEATAAVEAGKCVYTYTTTADLEFLRLSLSDVGNYADEANKLGFIAPIIYISTPNAGTYADELEGLHVYTIGDSYFEGNGIDRNDHWITQLGAKYNWTYVNYGINGSAISAAASKNNPMVNRYTSMVDDADADIIIIEGGRNDYNKNVPIGTIGEADPNTFVGAVQIMIDGLLQKYPNAVILCMTAWDLSEMTTGSNKLNSAGNRTQDYVNAFNDYVEYLGNDRVRAVNNADSSVLPVYMTSEFFRAAYCQSSSDISHFNAEGMEVIQPWIEAQISALYTDYEADCASTSVEFVSNELTYSFVATDADVTVAAPAAPLRLDGNVFGWAGILNGEQVAFYNGQELALRAGDVGRLEPITLAMQQAGAPGVRFEEGSTGLRFLTSVSLSDYDYVTDLLGGTGLKVSFGTLIVPYQYVVEMGGELTHASLSAADMLHLDIPCNISGGTDWYKRDDANNAGYIAGSIASIKTKNYARAFTAAGYAQIEFADGTVSYVYAKNGGKLASTVYDVAYKAINDRQSAYSGVYQYRDAYGTYTPYTTQQLELLESFLDPVVSLKSLSATAIIVPGTNYYTPNGYTLTAIREGNAIWNDLINVMGDDELDVIYVIESTVGAELVEGSNTYGGLLLDGYEYMPTYYQGKLLIGLSDYSAFY